MLEPVDNYRVTGSSERRTPVRPLLRRGVVRMGRRLKATL
jgi:hypothetical protein